MSPSVLHGLKCRACGNFGYACTLQPGLREVGGPSRAIAVIDSCIGRRYFRAGWMTVVLDLRRFLEGWPCHILCAVSQSRQ
jgi:hypothetical protein